jgi:hypothetical protein
MVLLASLAIVPSSAHAASLLDLRATRPLATGMTSLTAVGRLPARRGVPARVVAAGYGGAVLLTPRHGRRPALSPVSTTVSVLALTVADLDRDGLADVVLAGVRDGRHVLQVCWGQPDVSLAPGADIVLPASAPPPESVDGQTADLAAGDLTGDGRPDLALYASTTGTSAIVVLAGEAPRSFRPLGEIPSGGRLLVADADGDRRSDVLVNGRPWRGDGRGGFVPTPRREMPAFTVLADIDGDGRRDLVDGYGERNVVVQRGRHRGFASRLTLHRPIEGAAAGGIDNVIASAAGDLDRDGRLELVLNDDQGAVWVLRGARAGRLGRATVYYVTNPDGVHEVGTAVLDADRDGDADVVVARDDGSIVVLRNRGRRARHAVARLDGRPVHIAAEHAALIYVRCTHGVGACDTSVTMTSMGRRHSADLYLDPGERDYVTLPVREAAAGAPVRVTVRAVAGPPVRRTLRLRASTVAQRRAYCRPAGFPVLARSRSVVVVGSLLGQGVVACDLATAHSTAIDLDYPDGPFAVRGSWVAGMGRECGEGLEGCAHEVAVIDLRTGRIRSEALNLPSADCASIATGGDCGSFDVVRVVVGRHGQVAWVDCSDQPAETDCPPGSRSILRFDAGGVRVVATGPDIDARSLRASPSGRAFAWSQGAERHSVTWDGSPPALRHQRAARRAPRRPVQAGT